MRSNNEYTLTWEQLELLCEKADERNRLHKKLKEENDRLEAQRAEYRRVFNSRIIKDTKYYGFEY